MLKTNILEWVLFESGAVGFELSCYAGHPRIEPMTREGKSGNALFNP